MSDLKKQIDLARKEGYQDDEIIQFLSSGMGDVPDLAPQINTAIENNYTPSEILKFLSERKSPAYEAGAKKSQMEKGFLTAMQGPTMGFYDELAGAVAAPIRAITEGVPLSQAYQEQRDIIRGAVGSYTQENPYTSAGLQVAATLPTMAIGAPARVGQAINRGIVTPAMEAISPRLAQFQRYLTQPPAAGQVMGMGQRMAQAGATGLGYGAVGGLGTSEGETIADISKDVAKSAAIGGVVGPISQPVMGILGAGGRQIAARVSPARAETYAQQKVAEALLRDTPPDLLESALGMSQARMGKLGAEARIADVGGANMRQLLDTIATLPGETKQALERAIRERQAGRAGRLVTAADTALGTQGAQFQQSIDNFSEMRRMESRPFYNVIDQAVVQVDDKLMKLLKRSESSHSAAELLYRTKTGQTIDLSKLQAGERVPMNVLDTLKQSLYDSAQSLKRSGANQQANAYDDVRQELIKTLSDKSPRIGGKSAYAQAMEKWAGPSQMMDAAELGRKAMTGDIVNFQQELRGLTDSELAAFSVGALQALRQKTGTEAGQTSLLKMWKEPATQERLKAVFGKDYREFAAAVAREARLKGFESAGRGSQTAARAAGMADLDVAPVMQAGQAVASGNVPGMVTSASNLFGRVQTPEAVRNQMGRILLSREQQKLIDLSESIRRMNEARSRAAGAGGYIGGQTGIIGSNLAGQ
jgi:hypothetical protein